MLDLSIREIAQKVGSGELKAAAVVKSFLERLEKCEPEVGAFLSTFADMATTEAQRIDDEVSAGKKLGPLAGVPIGVKDNICCRYGTTSCASKILENFRPPYDAHVVEKLIAADAVIVGKTNLDEFAMGSSTENSALKKTVNPWDGGRVTGGSSGGSAAAVAARQCAGAIGSDTGGSIRQPAAFCGVTGLKPTYGRVSRYGLVAYGSSLDQIGPLTSNVTDAGLVLNVISGRDSRDSTSVDESYAPLKDFTAGIDRPIEGLKIAVTPRFIDHAGDDVKTSVWDAIDIYKRMGAEIVEVEMPHFDYAVATYYVVATAEASSNLARYDGVHYGHRSADAEDYIGVYSQSRQEGFGAEVKRRIMLGTYALSSGYYDAYYLKGLKVRNLIRKDFERAFEKADCMMMPVAPTTAFRLGEKMDDPLQMYLADIYTLALNLAGMPGISIPCGFDKELLPVGLQIISPAFTEDRLLRIGRMFETQTEFYKKRPKVGNVDD